MYRKTPLLYLSAVICFLTAQIFSIAYSAAAADETDLAALELEDLMNIKIYSAAKKEQKVSETAAAVYVLSNDDIRRSGASSIPEALRLVPGLHVARIDASRWAISSRGFNSLFANKMLVLIDGRSVYTPLFSGVYWDEQDTLLEDVERIEVIRGPGATLWGANAVNGVINIITKNASSTQGALVSGGGGTEERGFAAVRYGGEVGDKGNFRTYAKYLNRDNSDLAGGGESYDRWNMGRAGMRLDWVPSTSDSLTVQGDIYNGTEGFLATQPAFTPPFTAQLKDRAEVKGGNVLSRWQHVYDPGSQSEVQFYYDRVERDEPILEQSRDTFDIDLQHRQKLSERNEMMAGFGYRYVSDDLQGIETIRFTRDNRSYSLVSGFIQDEFEILDDTLSLIFGSKLEHNDFTGEEFQPSARLIWTPADEHTLWTAVSRALRTPSRADEEVELDAAIFPSQAGLTSATITGNPSFDSEEVLAYEAGYRFRPHKAWFIDAAVFFNDNDEVIGTVSGAPFFDATASTPHLVVPQVISNAAGEDSYGIEVVINYKPLEWWQLQGWWTFLRSDYSSAGAGADRTDPRNQAMLRSSLDLSDDVELDGMLRYVDNVPGIGVESYIEFDMRLGWQLSPDLELSLTGRNLLDGEHAESGSTFIRFDPALIERGVYGKVTWRFG